MLRAVVDDADQPDTRGDRWLPLSVDNAREFGIGQGIDVTQRHLVHIPVVATQLIGGRDHLGHVIGGMSVSVGVDG
ncbi:Uncharacterised protein [Mycobacteroides abscessus subsp. abscessus]|nr:Uncharacterised protein [Mycobacteroides abscessus subsp. abscessus]